MIETLNEIGYTVDFEVLNSKYFGVPQNRERIFIVAIRDDLIGQEEWSEETTKGQTVVPRGKRRLMKYGWLKSFNFDWPEQEEVTTRLRDILESNVDEKYYLDEEKTAKLVAQLDETLPAHFPTPDDVNNTIRTGGKGSLTAKHNYDHIAEEVRPVLTPERMEKRQNGRRFKEDGEESFTLTSQDKHGVAIDSPPKYRIRKLTPLECFRLQNFPDEAHQKLVEVGISHSQRYKMAGNAVTVSVVEAIAKNLLPLIVGGGTGFEESETSSWGYY